MKEIYFNSVKRIEKSQFIRSDWVSSCSYKHQGQCVPKKLVPIVEANANLQFGCNFVFRSDMPIPLVWTEIHQRIEEIWIFTFFEHQLNKTCFFSSPKKACFVFYNKTDFHEKKNRNLKHIRMQMNDWNEHFIICSNQCVHHFPFVTVTIEWVTRAKVKYMLQPYLKCGKSAMT